MTALWTNTQNATTKFTTPTIAPAFASTEIETWKATTSKLRSLDSGKPRIRPS
jgi:hypothetical protein